MAVSDAYLTFVLEQLGGVQAVSHRRMFGGIGLYAREQLASCAKRAAEIPSTKKKSTKNRTST